MYFVLKGVVNAVYNGKRSRPQDSGRRRHFGKDYVVLHEMHQNKSLACSIIDNDSPSLGLLPTKPILHCFRVGMSDIPMRHFQLVRTKPSLYVPVSILLQPVPCPTSPEVDLPCRGGRHVLDSHLCNHYSVCIPQVSMAFWRLRSSDAGYSSSSRTVSWFCPVTLFFRCHGILTMWSGCHLTCLSTGIVVRFCRRTTSLWQDLNR